MGGDASNNLGGLLGGLISTGGLRNSYATGDVTGGTASDNIGGLVGVPIIGTTLTAAMNNYYSGTVNTGGGAETPGSFSGITAQSEAQLQGCGANGVVIPPSGATCTGVYTSWSTTDWDFGTASQLPALKFAEHTQAPVDTPDCTPVPSGMDVGSLPFRPGDIAQPYCGKLLPNQPGR